MKKLLLVGSLAVAGVLGYILYKRSQQPGLSNVTAGVRWK
jgi:hypothetical protein